MIRNAAAGLVKSMWEFAKWIFRVPFKKVSELLPESAKESSAALMQKTGDFVEKALNTDFKTMSSGIKSIADAVFYPAQKIFRK